MMASVVDSQLITGVVHVAPQVFGDGRGVFVETFRREWIPGAREMIQANRSTKVAGSLVGLHYHLHQADYWYVVAGEIRAVLFDARVGSPSEGTVETVVMSGENHVGLFIPPGVAHGFAAVTDCALTYLVDGYYNPGDELGIAWDDPAVDADWGVSDPVLSERDRTNPRWADLSDAVRPRWPLRTGVGTGA